MWSEGKELTMVEMLLAAAQDGDPAERATARAELFKLTKSVHSSVTTAAWNALRKIPQ